MNIYRYPVSLFCLARFHSAFTVGVFPDSFYGVSPSLAVGAADWWAQTRITLQRTAFYMQCMERFGLIPRRFRRLVGSSGLEPPTSRLSGARSNHLSYEPIQFPSVYLVHLSPLVTSVTGGDDGVRTHDPLLAGQVLSQLSYTPI